MREAATSIGLPRSLSIIHICYRAARAGMVTGVLLAVARISGETAPLLFTNLNNQFWTTNLTNTKYYYYVSTSTTGNSGSLQRPRAFGVLVSRYF